MQGKERRSGLALQSGSGKQRLRGGPGSGSGLSGALRSGVQAAVPRADLVPGTLLPSGIALGGRALGLRVQDRAEGGRIGVTCVKMGFS